MLISISSPVLYCAPVELHLQLRILVERALDDFPRPTTEKRIRLTLRSALVAELDDVIRRAPPVGS